MQASKSRCCSSTALKKSSKTYIILDRLYEFEMKQLAIKFTNYSTHFCHFILFKNLIHWQFSTLMRILQSSLLRILCLIVYEIFMRFFGDLFLVVPGKSHSIYLYFLQGTFLGSTTPSRHRSIPCQ